MLAPGQEYAWYAGALGEEAHWLGLSTRRPSSMSASRTPAGWRRSGRSDRVFLALAAHVDGEAQITYSMEAPADLPTGPPEPQGVRRFT